LRSLVLLLAIGLVVTAIVLPLRGVRTADGHFCGSAWHAVRRNVVSGPGISVSRLELHSACKGPGKTVLKEAAAAGGAGTLLLLLVAVWPAKKRRGPGVPAAYR